jgi:hypothetical protein
LIRIGPAVAWALYVLLRPVNEALAVLVAWLRLVHTAIFAIAVANRLGALVLVAGGGYLTDSMERSWYPATAVNLAVFTFVGEVLLIVWLVWEVHQGHALRIRESTHGPLTKAAPSPQVIRHER